MVVIFLVGVQGSFPSDPRLWGLWILAMIGGILSAPLALPWPPMLLQGFCLLARCMTVSSAAGFTTCTRGEQC